MSSYIRYVFFNSLTVILNSLFSFWTLSTKKKTLVCLEKLFFTRIPVAWTDSKQKLGDALSFYNIYENTEYKFS